MHSVAKRKEQSIAVAVMAASPMCMHTDTPVDTPDEPMATEEELRAWSELEHSRPTSPSPAGGNGAWRLPKRYQGVFQERYILMVLVLTLLLFVASTFQMDTKTELEEIKRMYGIEEPMKPSTERTGNKKAERV
ncbi:hypothetical protein conserved [Leishmania donovani]|uniref:Uncharacterized protein n=3 Tax=Leishmania donovani species complex TaxID=38574 RepID=A4I189_LEIIN|nr:conserved hypothetical protein [Leishmania infantum JPCM5]XP_003861377.1 hypothetical protein, conserved [Leishmania donovani]CAC9493532.1 hypothetical_protein_-_conserved [Leishmania infantum]AYU79377.1 hypothetical protein LdCL_250009800 [Leishmania donovani]TPP40666.1 hypothetical protein CGC21_8320 [Leishmania donovani]TPP48985.1 hypothetical protein CGC20_27020 [Leishmania donovani]CAJ1989369.1 hypothetical protein conserved [Leishmania donovani]|eukprot:XP_001466080.1 conserved hypothetical protein [Leishmania infantum JPCM5]